MVAATQPPGYRFLDWMTSEAVGLMSLIIGVKNTTFMFWNRWRASLIGEETIMRFLTSIDRLDDWLDASMKIVEKEQSELASLQHTLTTDEKIWRLRRLSYLCHMAQWGCMEITESKKAAYRLSRDYYIEAEQLAHNERYRRVSIPWNGKQCWGNLHLPQGVEPPYPLVLILHGMDDSKEEHLMTELMAQERGSAVFCFDGPGQAEALFLDGITWPHNFEDMASQAITILCDEHDCDPERVGVSGISWGGLWALKLAASDQRVKAVYDLGGSIEWENWYEKLPYFLKTKFCQVLGATEMEEIRAGDAVFTLRDLALLDRVRCPVRVVHGGRDPIVSLSDKQWLVETLKALHPDQDVTLLVYPKGDHCCTGQAVEVRQDAGEFFIQVLESLQAKPA